MAKILIVDDNPNYLGDALPMYGYEVDIAKNGVEALHKLTSNESNVKFDLVLLDVMMPKMDGWQTLKAIRSNENTKHLPVIMLTAINQDQKMVFGLKNGADDYVVKPFVLPNLLARMEAVLRRSKPQKETTAKKGDVLAPLTAKEKEVLKLVSQGFSNKEIADKMFVREVTVKTHLNSIFKKLKVANRTQAVLVSGYLQNNN